MHCDFVLADARTLEPLLVIELDDKSHWQTDAQECDKFKDAVLDVAGVPLLRVPLLDLVREAVLEIRSGALSPSQLMDKYKVSRSHIWNIQHGHARRWD